ncbi:MAG: DMT family transporter [Patescibacteria group bacterium]|jgi:drug/metabolite transporter (DMT)-like permease|nr:DMT family transporter [Patescibacteria group bacterium]
MINKIWPVLFIMAAAFLWALDGIVWRPALYVLPVSLVVLVEHGLAFIFMLPFLIWEFKELKKLKRSDWGALVWVALFGGALGTMFITKALFYVNFVNLSVVVLIQKLQPIFALLLAWVVLKEKLPKKFFGWAILAIGATYLVAFDGLVPNLNTGNKTPLAALLALGAAFAWGSSTVFSKRALAAINFRVGTYLRFGLTTLIMLIIVSVNTEIKAISLITWNQFLIFLLIVFSSGGLAMLLYYYGLKRVRASVSTIAELTFPLSAILLEFLIRGSWLSLTQWFGAALMILAIYKVSLIQKEI